MNRATQEILKSECRKHANVYGCLEITDVPGLPIYMCALNRIPTILFPIVTNGSDLAKADLEIQEACKLAFKDTHQIIRLEVTIDDNNHVIDRRWVIVSDLGGSRF